MRSIGEFTRQILTCEMQLLMQVHSPFGAIGHIINDAVIGDKFSCAAFTGVALEFHLCDDDIGDVHAANYTRLLYRIDCDSKVWPTGCFAKTLESNTMDDQKFLRKQEFLVVRRLTWF